MIAVPGWKVPAEGTSRPGTAIFVSRRARSGDVPPAAIRQATLFEPFTIFTPDRGAPIACTEGHIVTVFHEDPDDVASHWKALARIREAALPQAGSIALCREIAAEFSAME